MMRSSRSAIATRDITRRALVVPSAAAMVGDAAATSLTRRTAALNQITCFADSLVTAPKNGIRDDLNHDSFSNHCEHICRYPINDKY